VLIPIITNNNVSLGQRSDFGTNLQPLALNTWSPSVQLGQNVPLATTVMSYITINGTPDTVGANVELQVSLDGNFWVPLSKHYLANTNTDYAITTINQVWGSLRARYTANGANSTVSVYVRG
jgi:hypothetical protein